jgi:excisionase family DNA binding protein
MLNLKETCTTREAARRLKVALSTVQSWVETGALDAWKTPGGHRRVLVESVERLLAEGISRQKAAPAEPPGKLRILVVEDEAVMRNVYAGCFARWQLPVSVGYSENGYDALLRIGHEIPDLIVTDLSMPRMDGFEMIRALRQFGATRATRIIVVTGLSPEEIAAEGGLPENVDVLFKPLDVGDLQQHVAAALTRPLTGLAA